MRRPKNKAEGIFFDRMTKKGWTLTKEGWPDFACYKEGRLILVEIKPKRSHNLKKGQQKLLGKLAQLGIECYRWTPEDSQFEEIIPEHQWKASKARLDEVLGIGWGKG